METSQESKAPAGTADSAGVSPDGAPGASPGSSASPFTAPAELTQAPPSRTFPTPASESSENTAVGHAPPSVKLSPAQLAPRGLMAEVESLPETKGNIVGRAFHYLWRTWFLSNLVRYAPHCFISSIHRMRGAKIGSGCFIDPTAILENSHARNITIGNDVQICAGAVIMAHIQSSKHLTDTGLMRPVNSPVLLEDHCFISFNAVIMPGVIVGKAAVVTSGSVIVTSVPPYTMVAGNPAKVIKRFQAPDG